MKTLQVVGYKNSGKTTLLTRWIRLVKEKGLTVAVLKHHGHSAPLSLPDETSDSVQFFTSGADMSLVAGAGSTQLFMQDELTLEDMKALAKRQAVDLVFIEGFKEADEAKVVLLRKEEDWQALQDLSNIQIVSSYDKLDLSRNIQNFVGTAQLDDWLLTWIEEDAHETI